MINLVAIFILAKQILAMKQVSKDAQAQQRTAEQMQNIKERDRLNLEHEHLLGIYNSKLISDQCCDINKLDSLNQREKEYLYDHPNDFVDKVDKGNVRSCAQKIIGKSLKSIRIRHIIMQNKTNITISASFSGNRGELMAICMVRHPPIARSAFS